MNREHWLTAMAVAASVLAVGAPAAAAQLPAADTAWRYRAASDIRRMRTCPAAELLVTTKSALVALDVTTGAVLWQLEGLPNLEAGLHWGRCESHTGISYRGDKIVVFDLGSGRRLWDAGALTPFREIRGYVTFDDEDLLLLFLRTATSDRALAAVQLSTGALRWQRDDLFSESPRFSGRGGVSDIAEYQTFLADSDTSVILYVTADGPLRLDRHTGATLWKGDALAGRRVPALGDYAHMRARDSVLVIPQDNGLVALDTRDGHVLWRVPTTFPTHASGMVWVPSGLLVRAGRAYVTVLDPATGAPRWPRPLTVRPDGTAYDFVGDRYFVVAQDRLLVAELATGDTTGLATLQLSDGEHAADLFARDDHLLIFARRNLLRVDFQGTIAYQRFYPAPGASFFEVLGGVSPGAVFGTAVLKADYAYFVTTAPDSAGRTGNSLVRVALADGNEMGRIWFRERAPKYWPDTARDQLLVLIDGRTLVALRFPGLAAS